MMIGGPSTVLRLDKPCGGCGELFLITDLINNRCRPCKKVQNQVVYEATDKGRLLCYWAKQRARRKGVAYDLDEPRQDIANRVLKGVCEFSGMRFNLDEGLNFYSPSLDRIRPESGYTHNNARVILYGWNVALGPWGEDVLREAINSWQEGTSNEPA